MHDPIERRPFTIGKQFSFHAAHKLPLHDGKCRDLHGHTYQVEIAVTGELITGGPKTGMVMDYGDLKVVWREHLEPQLDHQYLNETLPVPQTTAEHIAGWILLMLHRHLATDSLSRLEVTVWETPTSWARCHS